MQLWVELWVGVFSDCRSNLLWQPPPRSLAIGWGAVATSKREYRHGSPDVDALLHSQLFGSTSAGETSSN